MFLIIHDIARCDIDLNFGIIRVKLYQFQGHLIWETLSLSGIMQRVLEFVHNG